VLGDRMIVDEGGRLAADAHMVEANAIEVDEFAAQRRDLRGLMD